MAFKKLFLTGSNPILEKEIKSSNPTHNFLSNWGTIKYGSSLRVNPGTLSEPIILSEDTGVIITSKFL
jgi:hypothetical protein